MQLILFAAVSQNESNVSTFDVNVEVHSNFSISQSLPKDVLLKATDKDIYFLDEVSFNYNETLENSNECSATSEIEDTVESKCKKVSYFFKLMI